MTGQVERRAQIDRTTDHPAQFKDHPTKTDDPRCPARFKLNQHIHIASWRKIIAQNAAEHRQLLHAVPTAEVSQLILGEMNAVNVHGFLIISTTLDRVIQLNIPCV